MLKELKVRDICFVIDTLEWLKKRYSEYYEENKWCDNNMDAYYAWCHDVVDECIEIVERFSRSA